MYGNVEKPRIIVTDGNVELQDKCIFTCGHTRGMAKRPLNRGDRSIGVMVTVSKGGRDFWNFDN